MVGAHPFVFGYRIGPPRTPVDAGRPSMPLREDADRATPSRTIRDLAPSGRLPPGVDATRAYTCGSFTK
jgi:hypothetical protein